MAIGKKLTLQDIPNSSGGCNYTHDLTELKAEESPNAMNVVFDDGVWTKRPGYTQLAEQGAAIVHSLFDLGVSVATQKLVAHIGDVVYALTNLTGTLTTIRSAAPSATSRNATVKQLLIQCYNDYSVPYYWNGTTASMALLSADAPGFKLPIEYQGYLMGANISSAKLRIYYEDINSMVGGLYEDYFTLQGKLDDEITDNFMLNGRLYYGTTSKLFRVSFIGGLEVFEYREMVDGIGVVPRTVQVVNTETLGQVAIFLGYDMRVYLFDGSIVKPVSNKFEKSNNDTEIALDLVDRNYLNNCTSVYDTIDNVYRLCVTKKGVDTNNFVLNISLKDFAYYPFNNMPFHSAVVAEDELGRRFLIAGGYNGHLYKWGNYNNDNGAVIVDYLELAPNVDKLPLVNKMRQANMYFLPVANYNLLVEERTDFSKTWNQRASVPMYRNGDRFLGVNTALGQTAVLGSSVELLRHTIEFPVTVNSIRLRLRTVNGTGKAWTLLKVEMLSEGMAYGRGPVVK